MPGADRQRGDHALQRRELVEWASDDRPDPQPHVVHVELGTGRAARGPGPPDALQAVRHRPLGVRQRDDVSRAVADDGELPDLASATRRWSAALSRRHAVVEQHVLRRLEPGDVEVAQPPQVQPPPDHRVHAADEVVLHDVPVDGPEREVGDRSVRAGADGHRDAAHVVGERRLGEHRAKGVRHRRDGVGRVRPGEVEVDDGLVPRGPCSDLDVQRLHEAVRYVHARELGHRAERGHDVRGPLVEGVVGDDERAPVAPPCRTGRAARTRGSGDG